MITLIITFYLLGFAAVVVSERLRYPRHDITIGDLICLFIIWWFELICHTYDWLGTHPFGRLMDCVVLKGKPRSGDGGGS